MTSYDSWKLATPPEYEREEQDDDDVVVRRPCDVCQLLDCECFDAADGGEGDDMGYHDDKNEPPTFDIEVWIANAPLLQLKRASILIDTQVERRKAENEAERKELEKFDKPVRARRSDAGRPRAAKENAA